MGATIHTDTLDLFKNDWLLLSDFIDMFCGAQIGDGTHRTVYEFRCNKKLVVKIENKPSQFSNIAEWDMWNNIKHHHPKLAEKFLAPCINISNAGKVMLQVRTESVTKTPKLLPKKIPAFLADTKVQNWGKIGNNIVCHDYANSHIYKSAFVDLVKPEWWSDVYMNIK